MADNQNPFSDLETNDVVAIVLSFFFPGVGHMMLGQVKKGIVILVAVILTCGLGYVLALLAVVDALCLAQTRKVRQVDDWEFFPDHKRILGV